MKVCSNCALVHGFRESFLKESRPVLRQNLPARDTAGSSTLRKVDRDSRGTGLKAQADVLLALVDYVLGKLLAAVALNFAVERIEQVQHGWGNDGLLHWLGGKPLGFVVQVCRVRLVTEGAPDQAWQLPVVSGDRSALKSAKGPTLTGHTTEKGAGRPIIEYGALQKQNESVSWPVSKVGSHIQVLSSGFEGVGKTESAEGVDERIGGEAGRPILAIDSAPLAGGFHAENGVLAGLVFGSLELALGKLWILTLAERAGIQ